MSTRTLLTCCLFIVLALYPAEAAFTVSSVSASAAKYVPIRTDLNGDGAVNIVDVAKVATSDPLSDLNDDGAVNILDLAMVARDFGLNMSAVVASGVWNILNSSLEGSSSTEGLIYTENVIWENCTFTAKVKIAGDSATAEVGLVFCVGDSNRFYWAGLGCWGHRVSISKMVGNVLQELAFSGDRANVSRDVWYILTVKVSGSTVMLYSNGSLELSVNDSTFARGSVGMRTWNSHVIIDYVTVIGTRGAREQPAHDVLYADGTKLRSPSGDEVILMGTQCDYNVLNRDIWFGVDDAQKMKSHGGVVFELHALSFKDMTDDTQRGVINQNWIARLDEWVSWCEEAQLYHVISFGSFDYSPWGRVAPVWFLEGKYNHPWNATTWNQASIDFWDVDNPLQEDNRQAVLDGFRFIANRYKNNKYVLFGLFNEPFNYNDLVNSGNAEHLGITYARFVERIVDTIRSAGAKQLIFVDAPYCWIYTSHFEPVNRDGIVWEDHLYVTPSSDVSQWKTGLNMCVQTYIYNFQKPFYVGEYGFINFADDMITHDFPNWKQVLQEEVDFLKNLPVCGYSWHEYPVLDGEYYDYLYNGFNADESEYILRTIYG